MDNTIAGNLSANQQSLFAAKSNNQSSPANSPSSSQSANSNDSGASVKQQAQVSVLKNSLETQAENTKKLIESSVGLGQNVDTLA